MRWLTPKSGGLAVVILLVVIGIGFWIVGAQHWADVCWAIVTVAMLVVVLISLIRVALRRELGVDLIALVALGGSLALGEYLAGAVIGLMYATGQMLEDAARWRADQALDSLIDRAPNVAHQIEGGQIVDVDVAAVSRGDTLVVKAGEIVPVDGLLGSAAVLDESALTGESALVSRDAGARVLSGVVNAGDAFELATTAPAVESTYAGIVRLASAAKATKAPFARLADRYALVFVPIALGVAALAWAFSGDPTRALAVVVVATPCPLILAVPTAIISGISSAARRGIVVKDGGALESLARSNLLLFDKTGTLTTGTSRVSRIESLPDVSDAELLGWAASLEQASAHVVADSIVAAAQERGLELGLPTDVNEEPGTGIAGTVNGRLIRAGRASWLTTFGAPVPESALAAAAEAMAVGASLVFVSCDGRFSGLIVLADEIRSDAPRTMRFLRSAGIERIVMVTGDRADIAQTVGLALGVDEIIAECTPARKVAVVEEMAQQETVVMVGDGINDAPALAAATVGVAMGARGATASAESADVVLLVDRIDRLVEGIEIAKRTRRIASQSAIIGMALSLVAMGFAAIGWLAPVVGAFVQEAIDAAVILNALRALRRPENRLSGSLPTQESLARLANEHRLLDPVIEDVAALADQIVDFSDEEAYDALAQIDSSLQTAVIPHERRDEIELYPQLSTVLGGFDPMAPLSSSHREIFRISGLIHRHLESSRIGDNDVGERREVRRLLYSLEDLLRLHFAQEEELFLSIGAMSDTKSESR